MEQITIAGKTFNVPVRFAEGYTLNAAEAATLERVYHQSLRMAFSKRIKANPPKTEDDLELLQLEVDEYAARFQFGGNARAANDKLKAKVAIDKLIKLTADPSILAFVKAKIEEAFGPLELKTNVQADIDATTKRTREIFERTHAKAV